MHQWVVLTLPTQSEYCGQYKIGLGCSTKELKPVHTYRVRHRLRQIYIVWIVMVRLMDRMSVTPILSVKQSISIGTMRKFVGDGTCKRTLNPICACGNTCYLEPPIWDNCIAPPQIQKSEILNAFQQDANRPLQWPSVGGGVCPGGGCLSQCMLGYTPPWTESQTPVKT